MKVKIYTIKREGVPKNLLMKSYWTYSINLAIFLASPYISLTIH